VKRFANVQASEPVKRVKSREVEKLETVGFDAFLRGQPQHISDGLGTEIPKSPGRFASARLACLMREYGIPKQLY
jgi:hypothetical protein